MGVVAEVERKLAQARCRQEADGEPSLRTSTMTHVVWAPERWLPTARRVLAGLAERHPARTILLVPMGGRRSDVEAHAAQPPHRAQTALLHPHRKCNLCTPTAGTCPKWRPMHRPRARTCIS